MAMDTESDDSERWEDFFGSTTDLTPSLIGFYDTLTGNNTTNLNSLPSSTASNVQQISSQKTIYNKNAQNTSLANEYINESSSTSNQNISTATTLPTVALTTSTATATKKFPNNYSKLTRLQSDESNYSNESLLPGSSNLDSPTLKLNNTFIHAQKQYRSFKVLSPNVQRIISHSNTVVETDKNSTDGCNNSDSERTSSPVNSNCIRLTKRILGKQKISCIPLSKNTCKLSQAATNLDGSRYPVHQQQQQQQHQKNSQKKSDLETSASVRNLINTFEFSTTTPPLDNDKTPTNESCNNFDFECQASLKKVHGNNSNCESSIHSDDNKTTILHNLKDNKKRTKAQVKFNIEQKVATKVRLPLSPEINFNDNEILNREMENSGQLSLATESESNNKKTTRFCKSPLQLRRSIKPNSPILTYARVKMLANKSSVQKFENSNPTPNDLRDPSNAIGITTGDSTNIPNSENNNFKLSLNSSTSSSSSSSNKQQQHLRKMNSLLTDVANLKCRPLSSSSICSTSSSASSSTTGSSANENHHNGKSEVTSYLASVESLADHSEGELNSLSSSSNNTLSVLERSCLEIIDSERSYVEDLRQVIQGYLLDWQRRECLTTDEIKILFSNIQDIYEFNTELLSRLIDSGMDQVKISKCFVDLNHRFEVYTTYCTRYPEAISLLTSLLQNSQTNALLTSTQKQLRHTLPLGSYLLKPVQRILKYHLLLDNVRKYCDNFETAKAHEIMREVARNIDQVKKKLEQQNRVKELSGILDGWLGPELTVLGELRLEGLLMENGKPRMIFLFETMLIITKPKEDNRLQFKSYIYRNNLMLTEHLPGEPTSFNVIPYDEPRNLTKLTARNRDQKKLWAQNIKSVIIENLDLPSRAKELVFKLGDEEDRTPDKNPRKWSLNTSQPTPVYLERRNQYRRSEIRNRSKIKRKTVTNSSSFDVLNNTKSKIVERNRSIDDNFMTSLSSDLVKVNINDKADDQRSICNDDECNNNISSNIDSVDCKDNSNDTKKNKLQYTKENKNNLVPRSNSANRAAESDEDSSAINSRDKQGKSNKKVEVKMYNTKTMPKRIATMKKNRANRKETATFYMDISEFNDTILKITESTENLSEIPKETSELEPKEEEINQVPCETNLISSDINLHDKNISSSSEIIIEGSPSKKEKDSEIIVALLKESKDFEKILNKSPRKKSIDNGRCFINTELRKSFLTPPPPPPPRSSPPPLDVERTTTKRQTSDPGPIEEPIYETLLRNVHVPYKFSPVLNRSKSQQYHRPNKMKNQLSQRPESDYVTLVYDKSCSLENTFVNQVKFVDTLRNSDSSINYQTITKNDSTARTSNHHNDAKIVSVDSIPNTATKIPLEVMLQKHQKSLVQRLKPTGEISFLPRMIRSVDNINQVYKKKPPERRVSDVTEMCRRQSIIHKQGGEALGERMAHQDYADPKTLFQCISTNSSAISLNNHQRDSVFSLTSSSDSVSTGTKKSSSLQNHHNKTYSNNDLKYKIHQEEEFSTHSFSYEDTVENCLENDFRDSAIYSDDNERRQENYFDFTDTINSTLISKSIPQFTYNNKDKDINNDNFNNKVNLKSPNSINNYEDNNYCQLLSSPPPPPPHTRVVSPQPTALPKRMTLCKSISNPTNLSNVLKSNENDLKNNKSWVLQQIANFNK